MTVFVPSGYLNIKAFEYIDSKMSKNGNIFNEFLCCCGMGFFSQRDRILRKLDVLSQYIVRLGAYNNKIQRLRHFSSLFKCDSEAILCKLNHLSDIDQDLVSLLDHLKSDFGFCKRLSELPQLLNDVKRVDMDILRDASEGFDFRLSLSTPIVASELPDFCDPVTTEKLRLDASLLRAQACQLEEKLCYFGDLDTDLETDLTNLVNMEAELVQLREENNLARDLRSWV